MLTAIGFAMPRAIGQDIAYSFVVVQKRLAFVFELLTRALSFDELLVLLTITPTCDHLLPRSIVMRTTAPVSSVCRMMSGY